MEKYKELKVDIEGRLAVVTLNRPRRLNAFGQVIINESAKLVDTLTAMKEVRVVILTGAGGNFSSGLDVIDMADIEEAEGLRLLRALSKVLESTYKSRKITIAAVEGYCLGVGLDTALSCDILVSSREARFGQPEVNFSFMPGIVRVWRHTGMNRAKYMALTGEIFSAKEVADWGMISKMVGKGEALKESRKIANKLLEKSTETLKSIKVHFTDIMELRYDEAAYREREDFMELFKTDERLQKMKAFKNRR
ncbi:MAG: enoyl-CoA hydratase/isomerase family protein [Deltaproteobacteria bacterium]|uniref:Enoyl-CoA hydratase/isomerase family protein n=1 Tax=Candidatus Zymogenus saltonus TaxID=2844893 RepID=A0A9D8KFP0_9DELT|nr:enoyl-CoA hydratase/isomerase family protein [Candidatus Zymogenus saltonus]